MQELGIGRPSTYSHIISSLQVLHCHFKSFPSSHSPGVIPLGHSPWGHSPGVIPFVYMYQLLLLHTPVVPGCDMSPVRHMLVSPHTTRGVRVLWVR